MAGTNQGTRLTRYMHRLAGLLTRGCSAEHQAEGFNEGYALTGRHGLFTSYEAFLRVVDSMLTQHFKWISEGT